MDYRYLAIARQAAIDRNERPPGGELMGTPEYDRWVADWFEAGLNAGDPDLVRRIGGTTEEEVDPSAGQGGIAPWQDALPSSEWLGIRKPTPRELRKFAYENGGILGEDYQRFPDRVLAHWIQNWDVAKGGFFTTSGQQVAKPPDVAADGTWVAGFEGSGQTPGGGGGGGGGQAQAPAAPPDFFTAPAPTQSPEQTRLADLQRALEERFRSRSGPLFSFNDMGPSSGASPTLYAKPLEGGGLWWGGSSSMWDPKNKGATLDPGGGAVPPSSDRTLEGALGRKRRRFREGSWATPEGETGGGTENPFLTNIEGRF